MSRASSLIELALELARKHEHSPAGQINVVPVIVDDLAYVMPVLHSLCEILEGRLLDTSEPQFQLPVPGTDDALRHAAVTTAMTGAPFTGRRVEIIPRENSSLDAAFANPATTAPSPGEQAVLAVARAVLHRDLDDRSFAIIAYRDSSIDLAFRRAVWSLAVDQLNTMRHATLKTLVLVAEAAVRIDDHCQPGRGFQLALVRDRLLKRNSEADLTVQVRRVSASRGPIVLFLGAGFSASSHLPVGNTMRDSSIRRLLNLPGDMDSQLLAERFFGWISLDHPAWLSAAERSMSRDEFLDRLTLEQVISVEQLIYATLPTLHAFRERHDQLVGSPGSCVRNLAEVINLLDDRRIVLIEVNFDLLIEQHIAKALRVFVTPDEFEGASQYLRDYLDGKESDVPLLKLHGSIDQPDTCVIRREQTDLGLGEHKLAALRVLRDSGQRVNWIYVGASLRDLDLRPVLSGEDFARGTDETWVSPYLDESIESFARSREPHWEETRLRTIYDRLITETADSFFRALREVCETPG